MHPKRIPNQKEEQLSAFELSLVVQSDQSKRNIVPIHAGGICPQCHEGRMEYNGVLELSCNKCNFTLHGDCGCT